MTVDALLWRGLHEVDDAGALARDLRPLMGALRDFAAASRYVADRATLYDLADRACRSLRPVVRDSLRDSPGVAAAFGLEPGRRVRVDGLRQAVRVTPDGRPMPQVVLALTQSTTVPARGGAPRLAFVGGTTLVVDMADEAVAYSIRKSLGSSSRLDRTRAYAGSGAAHGMLELFREGGEREPFEALHVASGG
jgi:hypothetical protein